VNNKIIDRISRDNDEPTICIEVSNVYVYDLIDENEPEHYQTMIATATSSCSSSSSSSCFDEQTTDNDDGYSTHSFDDIDHHHHHQQQQQQQLSSLISPCTTLVPFIREHQYDAFEDEEEEKQEQEDVLPVRRRIEQLMWLSPFKKTVRQMMIHHLFN
jgi:hypothetical protein